eukprot:jgi/Chlat1/117/Chrsp1S03217
MAVLPLAKLGTLVIRTLSKPLAQRVKKEAVNRPGFRKVIVGFAQAYHRINVRLARQLYGGQEAQEQIRPLNEERAIQNAADFIGETVIFSIASGVVLFEYNRSSQKERRKDDQLRQDREAVRAQVDLQEQQVKQLQQRVAELEQCLQNQHDKKSWISKLKTS